MNKKTPKNIDNIANNLHSIYYDFAHFNKKNPLNELLFIICSVKTMEPVYTRVYNSLKRRFPSFKLLTDAKESSIAEILKSGGLSNQKARSIKQTLKIIVTKYGKPSLASLKHLPDKECEFFLTSLPNVGKKVARCIMLYSLGRKVFPVDTHCWRICKRIGWVRQTRKNDRCSNRDMDRLQEKIPLEFRFSLHVNFISHGRVICKKISPLCNECIISQYCKKIGVKKTNSR